MGQAGWGLADQAVSSATNFGVAVLTARVLGPSSFGSFTLAMATGLVVLGFARTMIIQPFVLRVSKLEDGVAAETSTACGVVITAGLIAGLLLLPIVLLIGTEEEIRMTFVALAFSTTPLLLQDFWRFVGYSSRRADRAFFNDLVWAMVLVLSLFALWQFGLLSAPAAVGAWGLGALAGALFGVRQFMILPKFRLVGEWVRSAGRIGGWFGLANLIYSMASQLIVWIIGVALGPAAVGGLRSVQNLYGPIQVAAVAGDAVALPVSSRLYRTQGRRRLMRMAVLLSGGLCIVVVLFALGLSIAGAQVMSAVFGSAYLPYVSLIMPVGVSMLGSAIGFGASLGVRASEAATLLAGSELVASAVGVLLVAVFVGPFSLIGVAWALAAASMVRGLLLWFGLARSFPAGGVMA